MSRYSPRTLAEAVFCSRVFHAMHRTATSQVPVTMANTVNLVNANGVLAVREGRGFRGAGALSVGAVMEAGRKMGSVATGKVLPVSDLDAPPFAVRIRILDIRKVLGPDS